ncbi:MAG: hypothetical protein ACOYXU_07940 [Nitrospirota bacterium]
MALIEGIDRARDILGEFRLSEFRIVRELHFYESHRESNLIQNIDMVVESEDRSPNYQMKFTFSGVSGFSISDFGGGQTRVIGFDVKDVSDRQWEGVSWEVIDFENNAIRFLSKTADIVSVNRV